MTVEAEEVADFGLFVGCETGLLKGVGFGSSAAAVAKTLSSGFDRQNEIRCLSWRRNAGGVEDVEQRYLMVGLGSGTVRTFDVAEKSFYVDSTTDDILRKPPDDDSAGGAVVGVEAFDGGDLVVVAYEQGLLRTVRKNAGESADATQGHVVVFPKERRTENSLTKMRASPFDSGLVALGGKEVDLQVYDLRTNSGDGQSPPSPLFTAKNVKPDKLQLRVPVWVSDLAFVDPKCVAIASRHGQVRLYDVRTQGAPRRPVVDLLAFAPGGHAGSDGEGLVSLSATSDDRRVLVGSATGRLAMCDFRRPSSGGGTKRGNSGICRTYKGCVGSVRWIDASRTSPVFAAVGLDRFLNVFDLEKQSPVCRLYLKSRLNCVLLRDDFRISDEMSSTQPGSAEDGRPVAGSRRKRAGQECDDILQPPTKASNSSSKGNDNDEDDDAGEAFWAKLKVVRGSSLRKGGGKKPPKK